MSRLIDADKLLENSFELNDRHVVGEKIVCVSDIEKAPTVNAVELPCKVGDTVYEPRCDRCFIQEYIVIAIHFSKCSTLYGWELKDGKGIYSNTNGFSEYAIGKTVFLTREEAEQDDLSCIFGIKKWLLSEAKDNG